MLKLTYPSDLTDAEWTVLEPLLPPPNTRGRPTKWPRRTIINAIFYILRSGGAWRYLPDSYPPWQTIYYHYYKWRRAGVFERLHHILRRHARVAAGRDPEPSAGVIDSQSSKTTEQGGPRGFDGAKKINGRKRHLLVDTMGFVIKAVVHPAGMQDREGGKLLLDGIHTDSPQLEHVWADQGYTGGFKDWVKKEQGVNLEVVYPWWRQLKRTTPALVKELGLGEGFTVLPRRWVVERTFAWLGKQRRFSKDYERLPETSEALIYLGISRLMLRRLARAAQA